MQSLIATSALQTYRHTVLPKLNDVDQQAWLADVLARVTPRIWESADSGRSQPALAVEATKVAQGVRPGSRSERS